MLTQPLTRQSTQRSSLLRHHHWDLQKEQCCPRRSSATGWPSFTHKALRRSHRASPLPTVSSTETQASQFSAQTVIPIVFCIFTHLTYLHPLSMIPDPSTTFYDGTLKEGWKPCLNLLKLKPPADQQIKSSMLFLPFVSSLCPHRRLAHGWVPSTNPCFTFHNLTPFLLTLNSPPCKWNTFCQSYSVPFPW